MSIAFQDLAVQFSEDEWQLLGEGQRELYRDVMQENYEALASLGKELAAPWGLSGQGWRVSTLKRGREAGPSTQCIRVALGPTRP